MTTAQVPAFDVPNDLDTILWVGQGQGLDIYVTDGPWRGGTLWGGPGGKWIHSNYLRTAQGNPC